MNNNQKKLISKYSETEELFDRISQPNNIKSLGVAYDGLKTIPNYQELIKNGNLLDAVIMHTFMTVPKEELQESPLEHHSH